MGKKLDALFGRDFKTAKFNPLVSFSISRLAVLKNQRQARCSLARYDIVQLLNLGNHDRALLRVEQVIKEQNMMDVFVMIEGYCNLLAERTNLIEQERECPEELKEAVAGLLYASTRCGEFPELQEMRAIFTSRFGKEFAARAIELRNNCGVNPKMIQKLSTRQPSLENRLKMLKEIASDNNIVLHIEEEASITSEEIFKTQQNSGGDKKHSLHEIENMESYSDSMKTPRKYKDVADAAEAAFKSAAYAAAAAKAAVELSKSDYPGSDDQNSPHHHGTIKSKPQTTEDNNSRGIEDQNVGMGFEMVHKYYSDESEDVEIHDEKRAEEFEESKMAKTGLDSDLPVNVPSETRPMEKGTNFDESDDETGHDLGSDMKTTDLTNEGLVSKNSNRIVDENLSERDGTKLNQPRKKTPFTGLKARFRAWRS
ncbi:unnamed protein product [Camellia sinensis]